MIKYLRNVVFLVCSLLWSIFMLGCGPGPTDENMFTYRETESGTIEITGLLDRGMEKEKLYIPKRIDGKKVTSIAGYAFSGCASLREVHFPDSIVEIGKNAFQDCDNLLSDIPVFSYREKADGTICVTGFTNEREEKVLNIPKMISGKTVTEIGVSAFEECDIEEVYFPDTLEGIDHAAFRDCFYLKEIGLPNGLSYLGEQVFKGCFSLENVLWSPSLETIPVSCFEDCKSLSFIWIPDSVKRIEEDAFKDTQSLRTISIPASVEYISNKAFSKNVHWEYYIIIITPAGSYAAQYAEENRIRVYLE